MIPSVATRWYELGLVLLDTKYQNELTIIEADIRNDAVTCCRKMFSKWLNTDELASWDKLIKAVRIVQLNNVASDIERLLLQGGYVTDHDLPCYGHRYCTLWVGLSFETSPQRTYLIISACSEIIVMKGLA